MKLLSGFFTDELAVDLGTVNTLIYAPNQGIVLNEPSAVAIQKYSGEVVSIGSQALKLLGREPHDIEVHRPIRGGTIDNFEITQKLLRAFIVIGSKDTFEIRAMQHAMRGLVVSIYWMKV